MFAFNDEEPATHVLVQTPVKELQRLRKRSVTCLVESARWPPQSIDTSGIVSGMCFELEAVLEPNSARSAGFRIRTGEDEFTEIGYDRELSVRLRRPIPIGRRQLPSQICRAPRVTGEDHRRKDLTAGYSWTVRPWKFLSTTEKR